MKNLIPLFVFLLVAKIAISQQVVTDTFSLIDRSRDRDIPVKLYRPSQLQGRYPVVIFSHGLGGSRQAAAYLGQALAAHGYVCLFIQHHGSDEQVWRGLPPAKAAAALKNSLTVPANFTNRAADVPFVVAQLAELDQNDEVLKEHLDLEKIGIAGHSYGARSAMIAAGEKLAGRIDKYAVPAIKAALVLSPNTPEKFMGDTASYYAGIQIPLFHMTGTADDYPLDRTGNFDPLQRTIPFQYICTSPQYLLVLKDATHGTFGGMVRPRFGAAKSQHLEAIETGAVAFFDAYLKGDSRQMEWLQQQYPGTLEKADVFEYKPTGCIR